MKLIRLHAGSRAKLADGKGTKAPPATGLVGSGPEALDDSVVLLRELLRIAYENPPTHKHPGGNKGWKR